MIFIKMNNSVQIRPYLPSDYEQLLTLFEEFHSYICSIDPLKRNVYNDDNAKMAMQNTLDDVQEKNGVFYVATVEEKIIGFIVAVMPSLDPIDKVSIVPTVIGRVIELYIHENYRRQGLGKQLIEKAETYLKQQGCDTIFIEVFIPNESAHTFYRSLGYEDRVVDMIKKV